MKNDFECIYDWLQENSEKIPQLELISASMKDKVNILQPNSTSRYYDVSTEPYVDRRTKIMFKPTQPFYIDIDIICYRSVYEDDEHRNLVQLSKVQEVCDWFLEQQNLGETPNLDRNECYQIECLTPQPFIRNVYDADGDSSKIIVDYAITVRFYIKNPAKERVKII